MSISRSAIYDNPRNVDDDTMKLSASKGGVVQVTMFPGFMAPKEKRGEVGIDDFVNHVCHVVETVGIFRIRAMKAALKLLNLFQGSCVMHLYPYIDRLRSTNQVIIIVLYIIRILTG